jgi:nitroreductase
MDLFEAIEKRASVRDLKPVDVPEADLERILDAGRRAPSGRNRQPLDFIVIRDPDTIKKLAKAQACLADVSTVICIAADPGKSEFWLEDVAAATENMLLAITALGYASVWIEGTLLRDEGDHKKVLGIPENMRLMVALPVGKAAEPKSQADKRPLKEIVHWDRYGNLRS